MRNLGFALLLVALLAAPVIGEDSSAGTAVKLSNPDANLPNQLLPQSINSRGDITGHIGDEHDGIGFLRTADGQFHEFVFPGPCNQFYVSGCTYPQGINDRRQIVGFAVLASGNEAFLREKNGDIVMLPHAPDNTPLQPNAINNRGDIVGSYGSFLHGFLLRKGNTIIIDFPGATSTVCTGVNNSGQITGWYIESNRSVHGFLWEDGNFIANFQVIGNNGPENTFPVAINDHGQVAINPLFSFQSPVTFIRNPDGTIITLNMRTLLQPIGGVEGQLVGINDRGDLVGLFFPNRSDIFGFLIPEGAPEP